MSKTSDFATETKAVVTTSLDDQMVLGEVIWAVSSVDFYVQLNEQKDELNRIAEHLIVGAETMPILTEPKVGCICAALYEGAYYRAKVLRQCDEG